MPSLVVPDSYLPLLHRLGLDRHVKCDPDWAAAADFLALIADHVLAARPSVIVECSSGLSTLVLARCCELNRQGRVFSLENGPAFAEATRAELIRYALQDHAMVIDAPLVEQRLEGSEYRWYDLAGLPEQRIDLLVIDGPPGFLQRHSRYPALPRLHDRLSAACHVFLDDAARADEGEIVALWRQRYPELGHDYVETERGCSILYRKPPDQTGAEGSTPR